MRKTKLLSMFLVVGMLLSNFAMIGSAAESNMELYSVENNYVVTLPYGATLEEAKAALPKNIAATVLDPTPINTVDEASYTFDSGIESDWNLLSTFITGVDGKMQLAKASNVKTVVGPETMTDYVVDFDITLDGEMNSNAGLIFRNTNATNQGADSYNGYYVGIGKVGTGTGFTIGYADGKWHQVSTFQHPISVDTAYTIRVIVWGEKYYVLIKEASASDFTFVYTGTQNVYAAGNVGLRAYQQAFSIDNFSINQLTDEHLASVGVTRVDNITVPVAEWTSSSYNGNVAGRYEFVGTLGESDYANPSGLVAKATVTVKAIPAEVEYTHSVPFSQVSVEDTYWSNLQKQFICQVIPVAISNISTKTGGMENFRLASEYLASKSGNYTTTDAPGHSGAIYVDSDDYKVIEAMCYALQIDAKGDEEMLAGQAAIKEQLEKWIPWIVGSQEADGYLYTPYTLTYVNTTRTADMRFTGRSDDMPVHTDGSLYDTVGTEDYKSRVNMDNHELYCAGHFYEAAVAHYRATGDFRLLDVAVKNADLVARTCGKGEGQAYVVPGHQEIELALIKLANLCTEIGTANGIDYAAKADSYIAVAKFFLDERGNNSEYHKPLGNNLVYYQNDAPVAELTTAHGHCVRANYMYTAMADVALHEIANGGENPYDTALNSVWSDMLTKMYVHGGIGIPAGESYSESYALPNDGAYCETCAQISNVMWNQRMNLLYGDSKYVDLIEWTLYNSVVSCVNLDGDRFFYQNHVTSESDFARSVWFGTACCPPNLLRTVASIGGYIYTQDKDGNITVNQYIGNTAQLNVGGEEVDISMTGSFPWDGDATLTVNKTSENAFAIRFRIPEWAKYNNVITLNGENVPLTTDEDGYVVINRIWAVGDKVVLDFPMEAERIYTDENITANEGLVSVRRGPILYCAESPDNEGVDVLNAVLPTDSEFTVSEMTKLSGRDSEDRYNIENIRTVSYDAKYNTLFGGEKNETVTLIPYYVWNNRGYSDMTVFLNESDSAAFDKPLEQYATPSASYTCSTDTLSALNDGSFLASTRWTAYGSSTTENYIEYAFDGEVTLRGTWVTWYHDGGGVQAPDDLYIVYWDGTVWKDVTNLTGTDTFKTNKGWTEASHTLNGESYYGFDEITTTKIRLLPKNAKMTSSVAQPGIVEWRLDGELANTSIILPKIYEVENGTVCGKAQKRFKISDPLSSANGFVHAIDDASSGVSFDVYMAKAGTYNMEITYSGHASYPNASNKILVDGEYVTTVNYETLSGWANWEKKTVKLTLPQGKSTVSLMYNDALEGTFSRLDAVKFTYVYAPDGDVNGDGKVEFVDAMQLLRNVINGNAPVGDMNNDGKINLLDVLCLFKKVVNQ
ncbi:MAG: glycoside hydrolase family 127 protein [Clostridia bacterium]|nr:glycoside hydrolase family 127 protein [Clostridia bacterium]